MLPPLPPLEPKCSPPLPPIGVHAPPHSGGEHRYPSKYQFFRACGAFYLQIPLGRWQNTHFFRACGAFESKIPLIDGKMLYFSRACGAILLEISDFEQLLPPTQIMLPPHTRQNLLPPTPPHWPSVLPPVAGGSMGGAAPPTPLRDGGSSPLFGCSPPLRGGANTPILKIKIGKRKE